MFERYVKQNIQDMQISLLHGRSIVGCLCYMMMFARQIASWIQDIYRCYRTAGPEVDAGA